MMTKIITGLLIAVVCLNNSLQAQVNGPISEISKTELIQKERNLLLDKILAKDVTGITKYTNNLLEMEDDNYSSFYFAEKVLLNYWLNEYQDIKVDIKTYKLKFIGQNNRIYPQSDYLYLKLVEKTKEHKAALIDQIKMSNENELDKSFLKLNLEYFIMGDEQAEINQDYINAEANKFLEENTTSEYHDFTKEYIRYQLELSKWGLGFEFFTGYGIFTQEIANNFSDQIAFGFAFDVAYKKTTFYLRAYLGAGKLNNTVASPNNNLIWDKNTMATTVKPELSVGYDILDNNKFKLTPFAGISALLLETNETGGIEDPSFKDHEIDYASACDFGLNLDWKIGKDKSNLLIANQNNASYWFLRFRYSLSVPNIHVNRFDLNGVYHCFTIGIGGLGRTLKRAK